MTNGPKLDEGAEIAGKQPHESCWIEIAGFEALVRRSRKLEFLGDVMSVPVSAIDVPAL
jgi:hypothetical protein